MSPDTKPVAPKERNLLMWIIPVAIVAAGALIYFSLQSGKSGGPEGGTGGTAGVKTPDIAADSDIKLPAPDPAFESVRNQKGSAKAPVVVAEYADFQCPACGVFYRNIERQLTQEFIATGKVRLIFHPFAFIGAESVAAAEAAYCAADQGKFWPYHNVLYENQGYQENGGSFREERLKAFAAALGLDTAKFNQCLDSDQHKAEIEEERKDATFLSVTTTPTLFINNQKSVGSPRTYDEFRTMILDALSAAGASPPK